MIYKQYQRVLGRFPADILRPTVSFQDAMQRRIDKRFGVASKFVQEAASKVKVSPAVNEATVATSERDEVEQLNALCSLLENRYMKKVFPLSFCGKEEC
jgi:hypothetical protein